MTDAARIVRPDWRHRRAAAKRRCEDRKKAGVMVVSIEVPGPVRDQLVEDKYLAEWDTENRAEVQRAVQKMHADYSDWNTFPDFENR